MLYFYAAAIILIVAFFVSFIGTQIQNIADKTYYIYVIENHKRKVIHLVADLNNISGIGDVARKLAKGQAVFVEHKGISRELKIND